MTSVSRDRAGARLIALDWGTSSLRGYLLGDTGAILDQILLPLGIMRVAEVDSKNGSLTFEAFEKAFQQVCGPWLSTGPSLPILACGMVGSAQGWREAPYLPVPADLDQLSKHLTQVTTAAGKVIFIVPGLIRQQGLVNVMRGEETQILGAVETVERLMSRDLLIGLPGTHSKWVHVEKRMVKNFETFMTGEVYAVLSEHTILAHTMKRNSPFVAEAFERGVRVVMSPAGELGVLSNIFSVRTLGLAHQLSAEEQHDYLSGLLIGHEINAISKFKCETVLLIGDQSLCALYERTLKLRGFHSVTTFRDAAVRGLWRIALQANLVQPSHVLPHVAAKGRQQC